MLATTNEKHPVAGVGSRFIENETVDMPLNSISTDPKSKVVVQSS